MRPNDATLRRIDHGYTILGNPNPTVPRGRDPMRQVTIHIIITRRGDRYTIRVMDGSGESVYTRSGLRLYDLAEVLRAETLRELLGDDAPRH